MKTTQILAVAACVFAVAAFAQDGGRMAGPQKEHQWLKQFVGEWEMEGETSMGPDDPPAKYSGTESVHMIGDLWIVAEAKTKMMDMEGTSVFTLGYDPEKKKYVGTWVDSMTSYVWPYEGTVDESGKLLTLDTEGPNPMDPAKTTKFRETTEFKSPDHRVFTSSMRNEDGSWTTFLTVNYRRKK